MVPLIHIRKTSRAAGLAAAMAALALSACADRSPTASLGQDSGEPRTDRIECTVTVASGAMRCGGPTGGPVSRNLVIGGQGTYVRLASSGTQYDGSAVFESSVTVQNLVDQPLGTADGTTVYGVKVFFADGPTVTGGSGTVTVANADGEDAFTGGVQPYFHYNQIVEPRGTSQPKLWRFNVPSSVQTFSFVVLVETRLQSEAGILRWQRVGGEAGDTPLAWEIWGTSANNIYAGGADGMIFHFDGNAWAAVQFPVTTAFFGVRGADARSIYAVGATGAIAHYDGNRWTIQQSGVAGLSLSQVSAPTRDTAYVVGRQRIGSRDYGVLMRSYNGGTSWQTTLTTDTLNTYINDVWAISPTEARAAGYRYNRALARYEVIFLHTVDAGVSWTTQVSADSLNRVIFSLWADGQGTMYAAGHQWNAAQEHDGLVMRSSDNGATWSPLPIVSTTNRVLQAISGTMDGTLFAVGYEGDGLWTPTALRSTDAGASWSPIPGTIPTIPSSSDNQLFGVWASSANDVYAGTYVGIVRWNGSTWSLPAQASQPNAMHQAVWTPGGSTVFAVGYVSNAAMNGTEGAISRSTDGGATWTTTRFPPPGSFGRLNGVWGSSAANVYAVGDNGATGFAVRTTDGGANWQPIALPAVPAGRVLTGVWGSGPNDVYIAGTQTDAVTGRTDALILRSTDDGATWSVSLLANAPAKRSLAGIYGSSASNIYAVGREVDAANVNHGLILHSTDGGASWTAVATDSSASTGLTAVWSAPGARAFAVGSHRFPGSNRTEGVILNSADGGATWEVAKRVFLGTISVEYTGIWGSGPGNVYAVNDRGLISRFNGSSWFDASSGTTTPLMGIHGASSTNAWAVGYGSLVLHGVR